MSTQRRKGTIEGLAAAALFGLSEPLSNVLLGSVSPELLAGLLYAGVAIALSLAMKVRPRRLPQNAGYRAGSAWLVVSEMVRPLRRRPLEGPWWVVQGLCDRWLVAGSQGPGESAAMPRTPTR